ncbi:hypothetical protein FGG78_04175 [Thioclava sp. BHET1]|nr:hypothetical protein FGG78_04175 [Thioclava sp. BHET1]
MKLVVHYLLVVLIPILASLLLFYGRFPLRAEANQISNEWLSLALSANEQDRAAAFAADTIATISRAYLRALVVEHRVGLNGSWIRIRSYKRLARAASFHSGPGQRVIRVGADGQGALVERRARLGVGFVRRSA